MYHLIVQEKQTLSITNVLSLVVFQQIIAENMPLAPANHGMKDTLFGYHLLSLWKLENKYTLACPKSHAPSLTRYIWRYKNSIATKEVYLDKVTLHNCDTKLDPVDDHFTYLSELK